MVRLKKNHASADEILELIKKPWANNNDISLIGDVGLNRAALDRKEIEKIVKDKYGQNVRLPVAKVPMEFVVDYYHINISFLKKVANIKK